jgi:hypothetical protein
MTNEKYTGVGRKGRRLMRKLWKESRKSVSLKEWARKAEVGDVAFNWLAAKKGV